MGRRISELSPESKEDSGLSPVKPAGLNLLRLDDGDLRSSRTHMR